MDENSEGGYESSSSDSSFGKRQLVCAEGGGGEEGVDDDSLLPDVGELAIYCEGAFPGRILHVCGFSVNGTVRCLFQWVRYSQNGGVSPTNIQGAEKPTYLVTADDVGWILAVEVIPVDATGRTGDLARAFANDRQTITCDTKMQEQIERAFFVGYVTFEVSILNRCLNTWEKAKMVINRESYSIKYNTTPSVNIAEKLSSSTTNRCLNTWEKAKMVIKRKSYSIKYNTTRRVDISEKLSSSTRISISKDHANGFIIYSTKENQYPLMIKGDSSSRDIIVLAMRLFIETATRKQTRRRYCLFF